MLPRLKKNFKHASMRGTQKRLYIPIQRIFKYIHFCGINPFSEVVPLYHQGTFIDINLISFLKIKFHKISNPSSRLLQSNDIKLVSKYKKSQTHHKTK